MYHEEEVEVMFRHTRRALVVCSAVVVALMATGTARADVLTTGM